MDSNSQRDKTTKCGICKDYIKNPLTLPCGHSFCTDCISEEWDKVIYEVIYSCPNCSKIFPQKPSMAFRKHLHVEDYVGSTFLRELNMRFQGPPQQSKSQTKTKENLQENRCVHHNKILSLYCISDKKSICEDCQFSEHRRHTTVLIGVERKKIEVEIEEFLGKLEGEIHEREVYLQKISDNIENVKSSSQSAVEFNERLITEMIESLQKMNEELKKTIREQEQALVSQAQLEEKQEREAIRSLREKIAPLKALLQVKEDNTFIKKSQSIISLQETDPVTNHLTENLPFDFVKSAVNKVKLMLEEVCKDAVESIQKAVRNVQTIKQSEEKQKEAIKPPKPAVRRNPTKLSGPRPCIEVRQNLKTRQEFLKFICPVTLNPNTAHPILDISDDNTKITVNVKPKKKQPFPERFDSWQQVLCKEGLKGGRFYWEVEWSGSGAFIGVALEVLPRKGQGVDCGLGHNTSSWCLQCSNATYYAKHNNVTITIPVEVCSPRVGIYLDYTAGSLEFYTVSDKMLLLHRFILEDVTEHVYPAFGLGLGLKLQSTIRIRKLEIR